MSYLARHRTICAVLQQIQDAAVARHDADTVRLCDEAITYARSMSARLVQYKDRLATPCPTCGLRPLGTVHSASTR